jgi:hypothetical protein
LIKKSDLRINGIPYPEWITLKKPVLEDFQNEPFSPYHQEIIPKPEDVGMASGAELEQGEERLMTLVLKL